MDSERIIGYYMNTNRLYRLTHHDVLHGRVQHHLLKDVLHQDEAGEILKDQFLEARQLLVFTTATKHRTFQSFDFFFLL